MRTRIARTWGIAAAAIALMAIVPAPSWAADTAQLDVLKVDGRTVDLLLTFAPKTEVTAETPVAATLEVDGRQLAADARIVIDDTRPTTAVLVLDSSGSMKGDRISAARAAANSFLDSLPPKVKTGLIAFNGTSTVLTDPTTDRALVKDKIAALKPDGDTVLYDAVSDAVDLVPPDSKARVLVLSDGQDTSSDASLKSVTKAIVASKVPVDVVAIDPTTKQLETLRTLSAPNEGNLRTASSAEDLLSAFSAASRDYGARAYITSDIPEGIDASGKPISAQVRVGTQAIDAATRLPQDPSLSAAPSSQAQSPGVAPSTQIPVGPSPRLSVWPYVLAIFAILAVAILAMTIFAWRRHREARQRLNQVLNYQVVAGAQVTTTTEPGFWASFVDDIDHALAGRPQYRTTVTNLAAADVSLRPGAWLVIRCGVIVAVVVALSLITRSVWIGIVLGIAFGWLGSRIWLKARAERRQKAFQDELPDFLLLLASGLRAGLSFTSALDSAAAEGKGEVARQIRRALGEVQLGAQLDTALMECADRMDSEDLRWTVTALSIQREVGGNLSTILEASAETIKQRFALRREVKTLSAEGRLSAYILLALPVGIFLFLSIIRREYISLLWQSPLGLLMLGIIVILIGLGWLWMRSIVRIKV